MPSNSSAGSPHACTSYRGAALWSAAISPTPRRRSQVHACEIHPGPWPGQPSAPIFIPVHTRGVAPRYDGGVWASPT